MKSYLDANNSRMLKTVIFPEKQLALEEGAYRASRKKEKTTHNHTYC